MVMSQKGGKAIIAFFIVVIFTFYAVAIADSLLPLIGLPILISLLAVWVLQKPKMDRHDSNQSAE